MMTTIEPLNTPQVVEDAPVMHAPTDATRLLLEFVRERDVKCPCCSYNLRNLTTPVCPECRHALTLSVIAQRYNIGLLLAATAPGLFAGMLAVLLLIIMIAHPGAPVEIVA